MKKMYYEEVLPKWGKKGKGKEGMINWSESVNYDIEFVYDDISGKVKISDYDIKTQCLWIKYLDKEPFKIAICHFIKCQLGKLLCKTTSEFKIEIGKTFKDDKRDIIIVDRKYEKNDVGYNKKYYQYKCNKCGWIDDEESWILESNLLRGNGCACCCSSPQVVVEHINSIVANENTHWMIPYFQNGYEDAKQYTPQSNKKVKFICPDCGRIKNKEIKINNLYNKHSIGCICSDGKSYGEKLMFNVLEQLNAPFKTEFITDWCKYEYKNKIRQGKYDFYFEYNNKEYIIEIDGGWHTNDNNMSGQTKEESKHIDDYKDKLAKEHGIKVIRIDCEKSELEYTKDKIMHSKLNNLFDLSNIDWNKAEQFALSNLVKKACEIKRDNPDITCDEISKIMKLDPNTIIRYLKKGSEIWEWINYNAKDESRKGSSKAGKKYLGSCNKPKYVEIFDKNNISLGIFPSCAELSRQSENMFGVKLTICNISEVCLGKKRYYKGYTFKYV